MELRDYIEAGIKKTGSVVSLAKLLGQQDTNITNAKAQRRGLPNYACVKLADLLGAERIEVMPHRNWLQKKPGKTKGMAPFCTGGRGKVTCGECPDERRSGCDRRNANGPRAGAV